MVRRLCHLAANRSRTIRPAGASSAGRCRPRSARLRDWPTLGADDRPHNQPARRAQLHGGRSREAAAAAGERAGATAAAAAAEAYGRSGSERDSSDIGGWSAYESGWGAHGRSGCVRPERVWPSEFENDCSGIVGRSTYESGWSAYSRSGYESGRTGSGGRRARETNRNGSEGRTARPPCPKSDGVRDLPHRSIRRNEVSRACAEEELRELVSASDEARFAVRG